MSARGRSPLTNYYVRGIGKKFAWRSVLETLEEPGAAAKKTTDK